MTALVYEEKPETKNCKNCGREFARVGRIKGEHLWAVKLYCAERCRREHAYKLRLARRLDLRGIKR